MSVLECIGLTKRFGSTEALTNLHLQIAPGRITGLLGPNGSGKSTLIKLACGLLVPSSGQIAVYGATPGKESKAQISYLPDKPCLPQWMSARQLTDFYADFYPDFRRALAEDLLARLDISQRQRVRTMSQGTQEKVQLILAMSRDARLYLLDEPLGGADPAAREYILSTILRHYRPDASILLSTHLISEVEPMLDDVIFLDRGHLVLQASADQIHREKQMSVDSLFREVFRC